MAIRILIFLVLNFAALGVGGFYSDGGATSDWYTELNKAPWTPPGWVFGAAWTFIMICFAVYVAFAWKISLDRKRLAILYSNQWILNAAWSPIFFKYHQVNWALAIILALTGLIAYLLFDQLPKLKGKSVLILPYFVWLLIATSLNAYISLEN